MNDDDLDRLIREEGDRWRSTVPVEFEVDARRFVDKAAGKPAARLVFAVGGLTVAAAMVGVFASGYGSFLTTDWPGVGGLTGPTAHASASTEPIVRTGDAVVGVGTLHARQGDLYLCAGEVLAIEGGFGCLGADLVRVVGAEATAWDGQYAQIEGMWDGEALIAREVRAGQRSPYKMAPSIPCDAPPNGWPNPDASEDRETAGRALEHVIENDPSLYVGLWAAVSPEPGGVGMDRAIVVGTVGQAEVVAKQLEAIYPYEICVIEVEFSASDLEPVLDALESANGGLHISIEPSVDRVVVTTTVLDEQTAAAIAPFADKVEIRAALQPLLTQD